MDTILKFDRVILTRELNEKIKRVGDVFEIANILDNSFLLRDVKTRVTVGVVSFEDFDKHFVPEENFTGWTPWVQVVGFDGQNDAYYRTNRRKTQVKFITNKVRAESCVNRKDNDEFNLHLGIQLAHLRCLIKANCKKADKLQEEVYNLDKEILDLMKAERQIIDSLNA